MATGTILNRYTATGTQGQTTSYQITPVTLSGPWASTEDFRGVMLSCIDIRVTSIVTATTLTWYLSRDIGGDVPLTPTTTSTLVTGQTTSDSGGVVAVINRALTVQNNVYPTSVYLWAKTNAGTLTISADSHLTFEARQG